MEQPNKSARVLTEGSRSNLLTEPILPANPKIHLVIRSVRRDGQLLGRELENGSESE